MLKSHLVTIKSIPKEKKSKSNNNDNPNHNPNATLKKWLELPFYYFSYDTQKGNSG